MAGTEEVRIGALWIEGALSWLEQLCLVSFRDAGHPVTLFHYGPLGNVPDGIELADAGRVLPAEDVLTHERTGSPALHSDRFRYLMLARHPGMIWADADAYCCRPFVPVEGHFHGWESPRHINGGVLGLPADSATLRALLDFTADPFAIPPWFGRKARRALAERAAAGDPVHAGAHPWGTWGPHALTHFLKATGEVRHALPASALYPVSFRDRRQLLRPRADLSDRITAETFSVHLYGRRMRRRLGRMPGGVPKPRSWLGRALRRHGIDPAAAPVPVLDAAGAVVPGDAQDAAPLRAAAPEAAPGAAS